MDTVAPDARDPRRGAPQHAPVRSRRWTSVERRGGTVGPGSRNHVQVIGSLHKEDDFRPVSPQRRVEPANRLGRLFSGPASIDDVTILCHVARRQAALKPRRIGVCMIEPPGSRVRRHDSGRQAVAERKNPGARELRRSQDRHPKRTTDHLLQGVRRAPRDHRRADVESAAAVRRAPDAHRLLPATHDRRSEMHRDRSAVQQQCLMVCGASDTETSNLVRGQRGRRRRRQHRRFRAHGRPDRCHDDWNERACAEESHDQTGWTVGPNAKMIASSVMGINSRRKPGPAAGAGAVGTWLALVVSCAGPADPELVERFRVTCARLAAKASAAGTPVVTGSDGWYFAADETAVLGTTATRAEAAVSEIAAVAEGLHRDDIALVVAPVPPKGIIYPDRLAPEIDVPISVRRLDAPLQAAFADLRARGVRLVDLTAAFSRDRFHHEGPLYCRQDSHWSGVGCVVAAATIGATVRDLAGFGAVPAQPYGLAWFTTPIRGDLWRTLRDAPTREEIRARGVIEPEDPLLAPVVAGGDAPVAIVGDTHVSYSTAGSLTMPAGPGSPSSSPSSCDSRSPSTRTTATHPARPPGVSPPWASGRGSRSGSSPQRGCSTARDIVASAPPPLGLGRIRIRPAVGRGLQDLPYHIDRLSL